MDGWMRGFGGVNPAGCVSHSTVQYSYSHVTTNATKFRAGCGRAKGATRDLTVICVGVMKAVTRCDMLVARDARSGGKVVDLVAMRQVDGEV
jgi:hypothetical protein